jgi:NADH dehydrogenase
MILVVGGTGDLGGRIAHGLLDRGERVRVLVRPGRDAAALVDRGAEPVTGDLKDPASLAEACAGVDAVVTTANTARRGGDDTVEAVDLSGNRALVDAAAEAGAGQFVFCSALGASPDSPLDFLRAKAATEEHLRARGLPATVLTPNLFIEVWVPAVVLGPASAGEPVTLVGEGRRRHSFVSTSDVAAFAIAATGNADAIGRTIVIGGPEALSWRDVVDVVGRLLDRPVEVRWVAPGDDVPGLNPLVAGLLAGTETYDSEIDMTEPCATFGVELTPMDEALAPFVR